MRSIIISTLIMLVVVGIAGAQIPQIINYQGRLTDDTGQPVEDGTYQIVFTVYDAEDAETGIWYSGIQDILVINGLFNYQLGSNNTLPYTIFEDTIRWLGIRVVGSGDPEIYPRTRLVASPYAFKAYKAEFAGYADSAGYSDLGAGRIVNVVSDSHNGTTDNIDATLDVSFPPSSFTETPSIIHCRLVLREPSGAVGKGGVVYSSISNITEAGFTLEVFEEKGTATQVKGKEITVYYFAIQLEQ